MQADNTLDKINAFRAAVPWVGLLVWGGLLLAVYALQELFFLVLATFLLSFVIRRIVVALASRLRPGQESPALERWLTLGSFSAIALAAWLVFDVLGVRFIEQGHLMVEKAQQLRPTDTLNVLLSRTVGAYLFDRTYGGPDDPRYQKAFADYRAQGRLGDGTFATFGQLKSDLEIGFELRHERVERQRLNDELLQGGTTSEGFDRWFLTTKAPVVLAKQRDAYLARWNAASGAPPDSATGAQNPAEGGGDLEGSIRLMILEDVKADAKQLSQLEQEWKTYIVTREWRKFAASAEYRAAFEKYYRQRHADDPTSVPFDFQTYINLREAYERGKQAFREAFKAYIEAKGEQGRAYSPQDFQSAMRAELARRWWITNPAAVSLRSHLRQDVTQVVGAVAARVETLVGHFLSIPAQLATSLLLAISITLDMYGLKQGAKHIGASRLAPVYDQVVPSVVVFGRLVGRSFSAQALIALCNTLLTFLLLWALDIQNELLLCSIVFFASFIPVLGVIIAGIPIVLQAILQPGGSITVALLAIGGILLIHLLEASVLSPKIIGKVLHLHPVLILVIIVIGEHLFGIWGLLLGVPVAVYILRVAMLKEPIPGIYEPVLQEPGKEGTV